MPIFMLPSFSITFLSIDQESRCRAQTDSGEDGYLRQTDTQVRRESGNSHTLM